MKGIKMRVIHVVNVKRVAHVSQVLHVRREYG